MPSANKSSSHASKQKRLVGHIEASYEERGLSGREPERRAWATVNKISGGTVKSGFGRKHS